jgi:hypothetical protein
MHSTLMADLQQVATGSGIPLQAHLASRPCETNGHTQGQPIVTQTL